MRFSVLACATVALAARPFLEEPDTGIDAVLGSTPVGTLPPLASMIALPDFQWAARRYMNTSAYTYYRNGAAGEWSYRNNLEVYQRFPLRPRVLRDITNVESTLPTTILGHETSAPFFISPCARGGNANPDGELGLAKGATSKNILYMASLFSSKPMADIYAAGNGSAPFFQQVYLTGDMNATEQLFRRIEAVGSKAIVLTVDSPGDGIRHRAARYGAGSADSSLSLLTWDLFHQLGNLTTLPIIPKGIQTVEDAREAVNNGAKAIFLSNHGGRQTDQAPSALEIALEIHNKDPEIFTQTEVYADGGVRYGTDIIKLLALGVRAVGVGRPFMYANAYGAAGVEKVIDILKYELINDAANVGIADLKKVGPEYVNWNAVNMWSQ